MSQFSFSKYIINKNNLINNIEVLRGRLNPKVKLCAVVKADAYGVGADIVASIINGLVDEFAVSNIDEGVALRKAGITKNISILGESNLDFISTLEFMKLAPSLGSFSDIRKLSSGVKKPLKVQISLNSGMNRFGFSKKSEILEAISILKQNKKIELVGVFSHLATKEDDVDFIAQQKASFDALLSSFDGFKLTRHLANTNALLNHPECHYDMVRTGFGLYGMSENKYGLKPVVSIESRVVSIREITLGDFVGYDKTYISNSNRKIAIVPLGYFDGVSRSLSNKGQVLINGEFAPIVGRVCMDAFMVDVTSIGGVDIGSKVTIIGEDRDKEIRVDDHAKIIGTSEYEVLSRFSNARMNIIVE